MANTGRPREYDEDRVTKAVRISPEIDDRLKAGLANRGKLFFRGLAGRAEVIPERAKIGDVAQHRRFQWRKSYHLARISDCVGAS